MSDRASLEALFGKVWSQEEFERDFLKIGHVGRRATVLRRSDSVSGSLIMFEPVTFSLVSCEMSREPTLYHSFKED